MMKTATQYAATSVATAVVELRQYTLHPGTRDTLVDLFDSALVESQEACGMSVIGQFRDLDRPDRFVWLRGFDGMDSRAAALAAFYGGPVWQAHRDAANATMIDFDDVLLLRPSAPGAGFSLDPRDRPPHGAAVAAAPFETMVCPVAPDDLLAFRRWFADNVEPALNAAGAQVAVSLVTEPAPNDYPLLPVREGVSMFVWLSRLADESRFGLLDRLSDGRIARALAARTTGASQRLRLAPTPRSLLR